MLTRSLLTLAVACLLALSTEARSVQAEAKSTTQLAELVQRDRRATFTSESPARARAVLDGGSQDVVVRAAAALALGEGGLRSDLAALEALATDGAPAERAGALFGLGRMGSEGTPALERALASVTAETAPTLTVAWLLARTRSAAARARLDVLAAGDSAIAACARDALAYEGGGPAGALGPELGRYYELRWSAARAHGLIDGQRWQKVLVGELLANAEFLDGVVLGALDVLPAPAVRPHVSDLLVGEQPAVLRAGVARVPEALVAAVQGGAWTPTDEAWRTLVTEIDRARLERRALPLLELASERAPALAFEIDLLRFRGGGAVPWSWVSERLADGTSEECVRLVEACAERGEKQFLPALSEWISKQSDPALVGPGMVARARLGEPAAQAALESAAVAAPSGARDALLHALAGALHDRRLWKHGKAALRRDDLAPALRRELVLALAAAGEDGARVELRAAFAAEADRAARLAAARVLAARAVPEDFAALRPFFPAEDDLALNVEIGRALVVARDPAAGQVLHAALWSERWSTSVLAGGLIVHVSGVRALLDQLGAAPREAREEDLRRVGFAIGEWGGIAAVEELARTRLEGDPTLQGALLGALAARADAPATREASRPAELRLRDQ